MPILYTKPKTKVKPKPKVKTKKSNNQTYSDEIRYSVPKNPDRDWN